MPLGSKDPVPIGSHLPRPLVLYTTMTMKVCKDGPWQKFYPPTRGKGVTGKEWQKALIRKHAARYKASDSEYAFAKANTAAVRAEIAFTTADLKMFLLATFSQHAGRELPNQVIIMRQSPIQQQNPRSFSGLKPSST